VDQDAIEVSTEAHPAHVAVQVLTLGIQAAAEREHVRGQIDEGARERRLETLENTCESPRYRDRGVWTILRATLAMQPDRSQP
jgi:hypothetical protein